MSSQRGGLASEQIATPQAVFGVAEKRKPGGTAPIRFRRVVNAQNTSHHILVDLDPESQCNLLSDSWTSPGGVPSFPLNNGIDEVFARPFWSWTTSALRRKQQLILSFRQHLVEMETRGWLQNNSRTKQAGLADETSAQTRNRPIHWTEIGRALPVTVQNEQLMPQEHGFTHSGTKTSRTRQPDQGDDQMKQKDDEIAHPGKDTKASQTLDATHTRNSPWTPKSPKPEQELKRFRSQGGVSLPESQ